MNAEGKRGLLHRLLRVHDVLLNLVLHTFPDVFGSRGVEQQDAQRRHQPPPEASRADLSAESRAAAMERERGRRESE